MIRNFVAVFVLLTVTAHAQVATSVRVDRIKDGSGLGRVIAQIDGRRQTITECAWNAWIIAQGRVIVYSGTDGAGGYENEGQSLWRYDVTTGMRRKLMTEVFAIQKVVEARARSGKSPLLVTMADGGLGAPHVAVTDPLRGEVWRHRVARFVGIRNGRVAVGIYTPERFEGRPVRLAYLDLDALLRRPANRSAPVR